MIALLIFSGVAAGIVWFAGRKDAALDPRLTTLLLGLLLLFPLLVFAMPKIEVLPAAEVREEAAGISWMRVLSILWAIGCAFSLLRLALTARGISGWRKSSQMIGMQDGVEVRALEGLRGPVAAGVFRKVIFVPGDWGNWDERRQAIVMKHELAHHHRRDPLRRWIAELAMAVHWFNPLVGWMRQRLMVQCEFACDAAVLNSGVPVENYARLLCDLAEESRFRSPVFAMAERSGLESRVGRMMLSRGCSDGAWVQWFIGLAIVAALALAVTGSKSPEVFSHEEIELRNTANPFLGE